MRAPALAAGALVALASVLSGGLARAQTLSYVCTTSTGHTISGDRPPLECKDRDVRVLNPDGSLKKVIPAPLTREQRKEREAERKRQEEEEYQARAKMQRDRSLLETYASVEEIDAARERALAGRLLLIERANQKTKQYERERKRLDDEAEFYSKHELPHELKEAFDNNAALMKQQEKTRADAQGETQKINERFDEDKKRYQELEELATKAAEARERAEREAGQQSTTDAQ